MSEPEKPLTLIPNATERGPAYDGLSHIERRHSEQPEVKPEEQPEREAIPERTSDE